MLWSIARKELLANLLTLRLAVAFACVVVLSALTVLIGSVDYSLRMDAYRRQVGDLDRELGAATIWAQVEPDVILPPQPLAILGQGVEKTLGSRYIFDAVCGEREEGTLAQMLANPVPRGIVLAGKLLGGCLSLWAPFAVAFVLALLIVVANPDVHLAADDWVRTAGFFALACLFLAQVFAADAVDPDSPHILFFPAYMSRRPVDSDALPRFRQRDLSLGAALAAGRTPVVVLLVELLAVFGLALWSVRRMEVTGG